MKRLDRTRDLNWLIKWKDQQIIKVVTGVRRCGKSTLFEIFQDYLLEHGVDKGQIIAIYFYDVSYDVLF